jgi:hypothetical protein
MAMHAAAAFAAVDREGCDLTSHREPGVLGCAIAPAAAMPIGA